MSKKLSERMLDRLRDMGIKITKNCRIDRTYAGQVQKMAGAMSWVVVEKELGEINLGGYATVTNLMKCPKLIKNGASWDRWCAVIECGCDGHVCKGLN